MTSADGKRRKPWDGYVERAEEREYIEILRGATRALQTALAEKGIASALIGGTALRLVEGLPRVSRDLDLKVMRATTGSHRVVIERVNARRGWSAREATEEDEARGFEGVVIMNERSGEQWATAIDLIPGTLGGADRAGVVEEWLCERGGVWTYPTHILAQLKMGTLIGRRPRQLAHDVFDVAWLMDTHGHLVDEGHRAALRRWLAQARRNEETWLEVFGQEPNRSWSWHETIEAMSDALDRGEENADAGMR